MHLNIEGKHLSITPALNQYIKNKLKKVKQHFDHIIHIHVVLESIKGIHFAETTLTVQHHYFHNKVKSADMYKSIDLLFDKIERQIRRYKEQLIDKSRKNNLTTLLENQEAHKKDITQAEQKNQLQIKLAQISDKPMNHLEAVLQLQIEKDSNLIGYFADSKKNMPSFLEKINTHTYHLFHCETNLWEKSILELVSQNQLQINHVHNLRPSTESVEDAIDFLLHNENHYRFFISLRTNKAMLIHQLKQNIFILLHS